MKRKKIIFVAVLFITATSLNSCKLFKSDKCNTCPSWSQTDIKAAEKQA